MRNRSNNCFECIQRFFSCCKFRFWIKAQNIYEFLLWKKVYTYSICNDRVSSNVKFWEQISNLLSWGVLCVTTYHTLLGLQQTITNTNMICMKRTHICCTASTLLPFAYMPLDLMHASKIYTGVHHIYICDIFIDFMNVSIAIVSIGSVVTLSTISMSNTFIFVYGCYFISSVYLRWCVNWLSWLWIQQKNRNTTVFFSGIWYRAKTMQNQIKISFKCRWAFSYIGKELKKKHRSIY